MSGALVGVLAAQKIAAAAAGITEVQVKAMETNAFGTTHTWTPDSGVTAGSTLVLGFALANSTMPIVSIETNTAAALTLVDSYESGTNTLFMYRLTNAGSGVTSVVMVISVPNAGYAHGVEIAGATNSTPVDVTATGSNGFETGPHDDVPVTTTADNDAVFALFRTDGRTLDAPASGYTALPASGTSSTFLVYDLDAGAAGVKAPGISFTVAGLSAVVVAAIKKA